VKCRAGFQPSSERASASKSASGRLARAGSMPASHKTACVKFGCVILVMHSRKDEIHQISAADGVCWVRLFGNNSSSVCPNLDADQRAEHKLGMHRIFSGRLKAGGP